MRFRKEKRWRDFCFDDFCDFRRSAFDQRDRLRNELNNEIENEVENEIENENENENENKNRTKNVNVNTNKPLIVANSGWLIPVAIGDFARVEELIEAIAGEDAITFDIKNGEKTIGTFRIAKKQ